MKVMSNQGPKPQTKINDLKIVSDDLDQMQKQLYSAFAKSGNDKTVNVKLLRSRRETKVTFTFKGSLEDTEDKLQKIFTSITGQEAA